MTMRMKKERRGRQPSDLAILHALHTKLNIFQQLAIDRDDICHHAKDPKLDANQNENRCEDQTGDAAARWVLIVKSEPPYSDQETRREWQRSDPEEKPHGFVGDENPGDGQDRALDVRAHRLHQPGWPEKLVGANRH